MVIYPEVLVTPDRPTVRFHQPIDKVDLEKALPNILQIQGWGCGTNFDVQFLSHDKTKLLQCGHFVVTEASSSVNTNDANPYQPQTKTVTNRVAKQIGEWSKFHDEAKATASVAKAPAEESKTLSLPEKQKAAR